MRRALALAATPGVPIGPNPRVGCVLLDADGRRVAEGFHRGAGTPHAEVDALRRAGAAARGATAVVTLEPCNHTGRTGPCVEALIAAGVRRVVFAQRDPNPVAAGGAATLRAPGIEVEGGLMEDEAARINRAWTFAVDTAGRSSPGSSPPRSTGAAPPPTAPAAGSPRAARATPTACGPSATPCSSAPAPSRSTTPSSPSATRTTSPLSDQPLRAVMGLRDVPADRRVFDDAARPCGCAPATRRVALKELFALDRRHVFLEGGPTLAAAFCRPGSSTRSSPTSRRCSWAPAARGRRPGHHHHRRRGPADLTDVTVLGPPAPMTTSTSVTAPTRKPLHETAAKT